MNVVSREFSSSNRRVLLFSLHNLLPFAWNGVFYEMMNAIRGMEDATVVAPSPAAGNASLWSNWRGAARATGKKMLAQYAVRTAASAPTSQVEGDFDIAFYACQFPHEIREINCIPHWRERTRKACIFLLESWAYETEKHRAHFRQLDMFDHVFVFNARSVPMIQRHTRATVSYLPTAADTLLLPASRFARERNVDYLCMGRRNNQVHGRMLDICYRNDRFYVFDLWRDMKAKEWASARRQNADMAARARHFLVWAPVRNPDRAAQPREATLTTRYFEGASSGAVMIGSAPQVPEFDGLFRSPEPVVAMPQDPEKIEGFLDGLEENADGLAEIARANRLDALERHDWAHRWAEVLQTLGFAAGPGLEARLGELRIRRITEERGWRLPTSVPTRHPASMAGPGAAAIAATTMHRFDISMPARGTA